MEYSFWEIVQIVWADAWYFVIVAGGILTFGVYVIIKSLRQYFNAVEIACNQCGHHWFECRDNDISCDLCGSTDVFIDGGE